MLRFKSAGAFPFGQMAKLMAVGVGFPFSVSFRGLVGVVCLLGWGTGKVIAVGCVSFASCLLLGNVCKGVISF